jgi:hypothetical protein
VSDLAGRRVERVPDLPDEDPLAVLPDWCCEILSPRTARDDKRRKPPLFARAEVLWTWLVARWPTSCVIEELVTKVARQVRGGGAASGGRRRARAVVAVATLLRPGRGWQRCAER